MNDAPHTFTHAVVRRPAACLGDGLTTADLGAPDHARALDQFAAYIAALRQCGLTVEELEPLDAHPDGHFVEDTAVIVPEVAVMARPGAPARRGETLPMAPVLSAHRTLAPVEAPGTLDGGDVLIVGRHVLVGVSERTNDEGARQLGAILGDHGYTTIPVPVDAGLHFKSSVNLVGPDTVLTAADFADHPALNAYRKLVVPDGEEYAGNSLLINGRLLVPSGYPRTRDLLEPLGEIIELDTSEFRRMDGGLTCLSLRF